MCIWRNVWCWSNGNSNETLAVHQSLKKACPQISRMLAKYFWKQLYTLCLVQSSQSSFHVLTILSAHGSFHHLQILLQIVMIWILDFSHRSIFMMLFAWSSMRSSIHWIRTSGVRKDHQTIKVWMHQTVTLTTQCLKQSCTEEIFQLGIIKCTTIITKFQRQYTVPISSFFHQLKDMHSCLLFQGLLATQARSIWHKQVISTNSPSINLNTWQILQEQASRYLNSTLRNAGVHDWIQTCYCNWMLIDLNSEAMKRNNSSQGWIRRQWDLHSCMCKMQQCHGCLDIEGI